MKINRRNFLRLLVAVGLGSLPSNKLLGKAVKQSLTSSFMSYNTRPIETRETRVMMGTYVTISVMSQDQGWAERAVAGAFREMNRLIRLLSRYDATSQVSMLNNAGVLLAPAPEFQEVLLRALYYSRVSEGAFDVTVAPLLDLYRKSFSIGRAPTMEEIREKLRLVDYRNVVVETELVYFHRKEMQITLDGIAKGYIVDKAAEVLEREGISHALIDAGGDIRAIGGKAKETPWRIGIRHPVEKNKIIAYYPLSNESIATSGGYEVYFDEAKLYTHIINPKTGYSPGYASSVTAVARECVDADAISTACFILEGKEGLALMRRLGAHGLMVNEDGSVISNGFGEMEI